MSIALPGSALNRTSIVTGWVWRDLGAADRSPAGEVSPAVPVPAERRGRAHPYGLADGRKCRQREAEGDGRDLRTHHSAPDDDLRIGQLAQAAHHAVPVAAPPNPTPPDPAPSPALRLAAPHPSRVIIRAFRVAAATSSRAGPSRSVPAGARHCAGWRSTGRHRGHLSPKTPP
jgi:hypothetical protein